MSDELLHVWVIIAPARIYSSHIQFLEVVKPWRVALRLVHNYKGCKSEGSTYDVIQLSVSLIMIYVSKQAHHLTAVRRYGLKYNATTEH